jgi:sterol desaturase/sphingolipid hydroxylase (fatty acid hydroxylase superfamily)
MSISFFIFIVLYAIAIAVEVRHDRKKQLQLYDFKDSVLNISLGILAVLNRVIFEGAWLALWIYCSSYSSFKLPNTATIWIILFVVNEFVYYWFHRFSHEFRLLWAIHVNHHSSQLFNFTTAARLPFLNILVHILFWTPLILLGFDPYMVFAISNIGFLFGVFQHTTLIGDLGWMECWFNTPKHHKIHHASNPDYINHNYGNVLIIFDRMFGTFISEKTNQPVTYGITKNIDSVNPVKVIFHEWQALFKEKVLRRR